MGSAMFTITLHSPKGGVGRTTACMALARAFQQRGSRVHVMDAGDHIHSTGSYLVEWGQCIRQGKTVGKYPIEVTVIPDADQLQAAFVKAKKQALLSPDSVVLVDTIQRLDDRARIAIDEADLIIAPFNSARNAHVIAKRLERDICASVLIRGLASGFVSQGPHDREVAWDMMRVFPPFENKIHYDGSLMTYLCEGKIPAGSPDIERCWEIVHALVDEIMEDGGRLKGHLVPL